MDSDYNMDADDERSYGGDNADYWDAAVSDVEDEVEENDNDVC
jgi:hypothetical protein